MKTLTLWWGFIRKNIVPILITMLMLTASMFVLTTVYGEYRYTAYTRDVMLRSDLDNGGYFMMDFDDDIWDDPEKCREVSQEIQQEIAQYTACSYILDISSFVSTLNDESYSDSFFYTYLYDKNMRQGFKLSVNEGRWLSENPTHTEAVIGGVTRGNTKVGDTITLDNGITAEVVGIMGDIVIYPNFSSYSNHNHNADSLFNVNNIVLFLTKETVPAEIIDNIYNSTTYINRDLFCYVVFDEDAGESEKAELVAFLEANGIFAPYDEIISDSNVKIDDWVSKAFPLPVFLIIISTLSIICICTVIVKKSMSEYSNYYMIGCTKRKGIMSVATPMAILFSIPGLLNLFCVLWFPDFLRAGNRMGAIDYILDINAAIPIIIYLAVIILFLFIMPYLFYRKYSPLSLYRRNL